MPIIPRISAQGSLPTFRPAVAPADTSVADIFLGLSRIGSAAAQNFGHLAEKQQKLADATLMAEREMRATLDIDATVDGIRSVRESHATAPEAFQNDVTKASKAWTDGLRPEQAVELHKAITPRLIAGMKAARDMKFKYNVDNAKATLLTVGDAVEDRASRLDRPDSLAFEGFDRVEAYVESLVAQNLIGPDDATKWLQDRREKGAYARLQRMSVSDNPQRAVDVIRAEEDKPGSTFAKHIEPKHRNDLFKDAQARVRTLQMQEREDADRARIEAERGLKELRESTEVMFNKLLDDRKLTSETVTVAANQGAITAEKQQFYYKAISASQVEGGPGNAEVIRQLTRRSYDINENPVAVQRDVEAALVRDDIPYTRAKELLSHLQSWQQQQRKEGKADSQRLEDRARSEAQDFATRRHSNTVSVMRTALLVSGSSSQVLNQIGQQAFSMAEEELGRVSNAMRAGGVDPQEWWDANRVRFLSLVQRNAVIRAQQERALLPPLYRPMQHVDELKTDPAFMALPRDQKFDIYNRLRDVIDLEQATKANMASGSSGGASTAPQNTPGVPQGDADKRKQDGKTPPVGTGTRRQ